MWNPVLVTKFSMRLKIMMYLHNEDNTSVAKLLGCTADRVSSLRCSGARPTENEVEILAKHYNVPDSFILGESQIRIITQDQFGHQNIVYSEDLL